MNIPIYILKTKQTYATRRPNIQRHFPTKKFKLARINSNRSNEVHNLHHDFHKMF
jgi:hypothetical protein